MATKIALTDAMTPEAKAKVDELKRMVRFLLNVAAVLSCPKTKKGECKHKRKLTLQLSICEPPVDVEFGPEHHICMKCWEKYAKKMIA